jgi:hypothetical protein
MTLFQHLSNRGWHGRQLSRLRPLQALGLGILSCLLAVTIALPSWSLTPLFSPLPPVRANAQPVNAHLMADLREATQLAQAMDPGTAPKRFAAIMTPGGVVPTQPMTDATAVGGAVLVGDRLIVRGDFGNLSSAFRDYSADPTTPPNPNITSAVHIHRGEPGKNGPFQYALSVMLNSSGLGGRFMGDYTLSSEQLQALSTGNLYMDLHTRQNRAGELRGTFQPL